MASWTFSVASLHQTTLNYRLRQRPVFYTPSVATTLPCCSKFQWLGSWADFLKLGASLLGEVQSRPCVSEGSLPWREGRGTGLGDVSRVSFLCQMRHQIDCYSSTGVLDVGRQRGPGVVYSSSKKCQERAEGIFFLILVDTCPAPSAHQYCQVFSYSTFWESCVPAPPPLWSLLMPR